jgi:hypothetical protein
MKVMATTYPFLKMIAPGGACLLEEVGRAMIHVSRFGWEKKILGNRDIEAVAKRAT